MRSCVVVVGVVVSGLASAADLNGNGCVDAYEPVCVDLSAAVGAGSTFAAAGGGGALGSGGTVGVQASVGPDVAVGTGVVIARKASLAGRATGPLAQLVGDRTIVGARVSVGADASIGADNVLGRASTVGANLVTGASVVLGYATQVGSDVNLGASARIGNLGKPGDFAVFGVGARLGRASVVDAGTGTGAGQHASVNGAIGPAVRVRSGAAIGVAKVRRGADVCGVIEDGAVIGRGVTVQCGATVSAGAVVRAGATINAGATVPVGAVVPRGTTVLSPAVTVVTAGASRTWSDGTTAASCEGYLHPTGAEVYSGSTGDGVYSISPTGGAPFDVWCDQTRDGGGWTLWASLVMGPSALTGTVLPSSAGYMDTTRYAALHTQATVFKARGSTTGLAYYLPAAEAAAGNCHSMATPVPENVDGATYTTVYGHKEVSGCTLTGGDYSWLSVGAGPAGSYNVVSGSTPGVSMWHQDTATGSLATRSSTEARVEMYVR